MKVKLVRGPGNQYQDVQIEEYLKNFQWDSVQYQYDKTLEYLGMKVQKEAKSGEEKVKVQCDKVTTLKQTLNALTKKKGTNMLQSDLADYVYENAGKVKGEKFVNTHFDNGYSSMLTSVLVAVNKKRE